MPEELIDFERALALTLAAVEPLPHESVPLLELGGRVAAADVAGLVDVPSTDVSLRDGYAVRSPDLAAASSGDPVRLKLIGDAAAGRPFAGELLPLSTVRVLSGASIPCGADAVLAEEQARADGETVSALAGAGPGMYIQPRGADVAAGRPIIAAGTILRPAQVGLLAAAGYDRLDVVRRPRVGIIATGDELVTPGGTLRPGLIYASNQAALASWCAHFDMQTEVVVVGDDRQAIEQQLVARHETCDALITTGGAWGSERDLVTGVLERLGWRRLYRHVRLMPGKAAGCGLWDGRPVFCLPGGPPASQMAFLQLALPALHKLAGYRHPGLPRLMAELGADVAGRPGWTQFAEGRVTAADHGMQFHPQRLASRLQSMAEAEGLVMVPPDTAALRRGTIVPVQLLAGI